MDPDQVIVITGAIGSGKSFIAEVFRGRGWTILDADKVGHQVLQTPEIVEQIRRKWPAAVRKSRVDRKALADLVFADLAELRSLEELTHPHIRNAIKQWISTPGGKRVVEVSVLKVIEPNWATVVVIDAPLERRIERLQKRGLTQIGVSARVAAQPQRRDWLEAAAIALDNGSDGRQAAESLARYLESS
jgi:dephospho-CoA kinase